jgi:hypothetical protein
MSSDAPPTWLAWLLLAATTTVALGLIGALL